MAESHGKKTRRLGIYGGSFYPPHKGHLRAALAFYDELQLDELLIMPAGVPPHKRLEGCFPPALRLHLCRVCFSRDAVGQRNIRVSDYEIAKEGISYTATTLSHFAPLTEELYFLCGTDMYLTLDRWYRPDLIFQNGIPVLARRECDTENDPKTEAQRKHFLETYGRESVFLTLPPFPISSSEIRSLLARGKDVSTYLTPSVLREIRHLGLFDEETALCALREQVKALEDPSRAAHSLSVEKECLYLSGVFGLSDGERMALRVSALLHDLTHRYTKDQHRALLLEGGYTKEEADALLAFPATVHQTTGAILASQRFPYLMAPEVAPAIACHTTGSPDMTLLSKLLCLADYIEERRTHAPCLALRKRFHTALAMGDTDPLLLLDAAMQEYLDGTLSHLKSIGVTPDPKTEASAAVLPKNLPPLPPVKSRESL